MQQIARRVVHTTHDASAADGRWIVAYAVAMVGFLTLAIGGFNLVGNSFEETLPGTDVALVKTYPQSR